MLIENLKRIAFYSLAGVILSLSFSISLYEVTSVIFVLSAAAAMILSRDTRLLKSRWMIFLLLYLAANLLSLTQSHYPIDSLKGIVRVLRLGLLSLGVIYIIDSEEKFTKIFKWSLLVGFLIALDGLVQGFTGFELIRQREMTAYALNAGRVTASFRHANDFSAYLTLLIFFFVGVAAEAKNLKLSPRQLIFVAAGSLALLGCLFWTYCRGAWVGVAAAFFLFSIFKRKKMLLAFLAVLLLWAGFFSPPILQDRLRSLWDPKNGTITERKVLMGESLSMIQTSPWLGLGLNTFSDNAPLYKSKTNRTDVQYVHNGFLQMTVETGVVGLAAFLCLLLFFLVSTLPVFFKKVPGRLEVGGAALVFGVIAFLIHSLTDTNLHSLLLVSNFWLCMGLALAAAALVNPKKFYSA